MRIGEYTDQHAVAPLPQPIPGWSPPRRPPRATLVPALGGMVAHLAAGHPGDELATLRWDYMYASPSVEGGQITTTAEMTIAAPFVLLGERLAAPVDPGDFAAVGAARLYLRHQGAAVGGYLTLDIWDDAAGVPNRKLGTIAYIDAATITNAWAGYEFWGDTAWPISATGGGHLVLSAVEMTGAGQIQWGASGVGAGHYKYTAAAWGAVANQDLSCTTWQGSAFCVLRGLLGAGNYVGSTGPEVVEVDLGDGQLYNAVLLDLDGQQIVKPRALGGSMATPPASPGVARAVSLTMGLYGELDG